MTNGDDFEIFGFDIGCAVVGAVVFRPELFEVLAQSGLTVGVESVEDKLGRAEELSEIFDHVGGRKRKEKDKRAAR